MILPYICAVIAMCFFVFCIKVINDRKHKHKTTVDIDTSTPQGMYEYLRAKDVLEDTAFDTIAVLARDGLFGKEAQTTMLKIDIDNIANIKAEIKAKELNLPRYPIANLRYTTSSRWAVDHDLLLRRLSK